ncbi:MAG: lytic transglycosylase domain-containing protein, partial [bacterium]|nr:lytic transglycosylase domain-containing protein [bacterium]
ANAAWASNEIKEAWTLAGDALLAQPDGRAAQPASDLLILCTRAQLNGKLPDGTVIEGGGGSEFGLPLSSGVLTAWATNAALYGGVAEVQGLLKQLGGKLPSKDIPDLLQARATISAAAGDVAALNALVSSPQFAQSPVETRAEVRFLLAKLLRAKKQWNAALEQYRALAELNSAHKAEALLGRYLVLKEVQEPLNLDVAVPLLEDCIKASQSDETTGGLNTVVKALEELVPLLISGNRDSDVRRLLADTELPPDRTDDLTSPKLIDITNTIDQLLALQNYWNDYVSSGTEKKKQFNNWTYYELADADEFLPSVGPPELWAELITDFLAGLGLGVEATEAASMMNGDQQSQILHYNILRFHQDWYDLPRLQWEATELLEGGRLTDARVLDYALEQAYPTPHKEIVDKVAKSTGVDSALIYAVMKKESNFKPDAVSGVGATGLMQLMPGTARMMANSRGLKAAPLTDPEVNIPLGAAYLDNLQDELAGKIAPPGPGESEHDALIRAVLHSYNAGPGNYAKWRGLYPNSDAVLLADLIPNEENEEFGKRVWKYYLIYKWRLSQ